MEIKHTVETQKTPGIQCVCPSSKQETNPGSNTIEDRADNEKSSSRSTRQKSYTRICSDGLVNLTGASKTAEGIVHLILLLFHLDLNNSILLCQTYSRTAEADETDQDDLEPRIRPDLVQSRASFILLSACGDTPFFDCFIRHLVQVETKCPGKWPRSYVGNFQHCRYFPLPDYSGPAY